MSINNGFSGIKSFASASFLGLFLTSSGMNSDNIAEPAKNGESLFFVSEHTQQRHRPFLKHLQNETSGLFALILNEKDLGVEFDESDIQRLRLYSSCDSNLYPQTKEGVDTLGKLDIAQNNILKRIQSLPDDPRSPVTATEMKEALYENPKNFVDISHGIAYNLAVKNASAISLQKYLFPKKPELKLAAAILPSEPMSHDNKVTTLAGIAPHYISNIKSTPEDLFFFTMSHELAGHSDHKHTNSDSKYNCISLNTAFTDKVIAQESFSDVKAAVVFKKAQNQHLTSPADTVKEFAALRALGNLYLSNNHATANRTDHINDHVTTLLFDPKKPNFQSDLDPANMPDVSTLPLLINKLADFIGGYAESNDKNKALSLNPAEMIDIFEDYARFGEQMKTGTYKSDGTVLTPANPQHLYESVAYIKRNNLLENIRDDIKPEYIIAMNDLIDDFLEAAEQYAPKLKNPVIAANIEKTFKKSDFKFLTFNSLFGLLPAEQEKTPEPTPVPQI